MYRSACNTSALALAIIACGTPIFAAGAQSVQPEPFLQIELAPYPIGTSALTLRASVRGHEGTFLFDTGEGVSMITPSFAQKIDCHPWGQLSAFRMTGERLDLPHCDDLKFGIQGAAFAAPSVIVFDLMSFYDKGAAPLDGAIGLDIFAGRAVTFQTVRKRLIVESNASLAARVAHATPIPIRIVRDAEGLGLDVNIGVPPSAGMAWMELDSGNSGPTFFIAKYLAPLFQFDSTRKEPQAVRLTIGGIPVEGMTRTLDHMAIDGNIGVTFLRKWDVALGLATGKAWVTPANAN